MPSTIVRRLTLDLPGGFDRPVGRVGEEGDGVKVLASNPPWTVKLAYAGGEYDVPVFKDYQTTFSSNSLTERPTPGIVFAETADRAAKAPGQVERQPSDDG